MLLPPVRRDARFATCAASGSADAAHLQRTQKRQPMRGRLEGGSVANPSEVTDQTEAAAGIRRSSGGGL
eukprot:5290535-Prymnesium_polylepis.1